MKIEPDYNPLLGGTNIVFKYVNSSKVLDLNKFYVWGCLEMEPRLKRIDNGKGISFILMVMPVNFLLLRAD